MYFEYPKALLPRRIPSWWTSICVGGKAVYWDDTMTLRSMTESSMVALEQYLYHDKIFEHLVLDLYERFHFIDSSRPKHLRTLNFDNLSSEKVEAQLLRAFRWLYVQLPLHIREHLAYLPDVWVLEIGVVHAQIDFTTAVTGPAFLDFCRQVVWDAGMMKMGTLYHESQQVLTWQRECQARELVGMTKEEALMRDVLVLDTLQRENPEEYQIVIEKRATVRLSEVEAAQEMKKQRRKSKKLAELNFEMDEEKWIFKEEKKIQKLAELGNVDTEAYVERRAALDLKIHQRDVRLRRKERKKSINVKKTVDG